MLQANLDKIHVFQTAFNQNYEGDIKTKGDVLKVFSVGRPTVNPYTIGSNVTYQRLRPTSQVLTIDQDDYWGIEEDALEEMLQNPSTFEQLARNGAYALIDKQDAKLAQALATNAASVLNPTQIGSGALDDKIYDVIVHSVRVLKDASVPEGSVKAYIPYWASEKLKLDLRFTGFNTARAQAIMAARGIASGADTPRGYLGDIEGCEVYESGNCPDNNGTAVTNADGPSTMLVGSDIGATWGELVTPEGMVQTFDSSENPTNFDKLMRARHVYGFMVNQPDAWAKCVITQGQ